MSGCPKCGDPAAALLPSGFCEVCHWKAKGTRVADRFFPGKLEPADEAAWRTGSALVLGIWGGTWKRIKGVPVIVLDYEGAGPGPVHTRQKYGVMMAEAIEPLLQPVPAALWHQYPTLYQRPLVTVWTGLVAPIEAWMIYGEGVEVAPLERPPLLGEPPPVETRKGKALPWKWTVGPTSRSPGP